MRTLVCLLAATVISGCAHFFPAESACPEILSAEAWVNQMPGPEKKTPSLIVSARLDSEALWMLTALTQAEDPPVLQLDLSPGGAGYPGNTGFRSAKAGHPDKIEIFCAGKLHHTIRHVMTVS